jgi:subtilisin family serine protease
VAGIIAGGMTVRARGVRVLQQLQDPDNPQATTTHERKVEPGLLCGIAAHTKLVSLKVLDDQGRGSSMNIVRALEHIRTRINGPKLMRVHGVNLSVGYEFDPKWFACGQSPVCVAVNRLVRSGVVVVVAAGNTGYGVLSSIQRQTSVGLTMTINDPGNAELPITVGATHRDMPHTYGVSYFSSKGPTGDGRSKPDLVAPGERITSCAAGDALAEVGGKPGEPVYVEDSGTSMAAPHVSGAIAAFLSIRQEFVGQPEQVKDIFTRSATPLGRERYFEGHGLVDLMRAIQSV